MFGAQTYILLYDKQMWQFTNFIQILKFMNFFCPCMNDRVGNQGEIDFMSSSIKVAVEHPPQNYECLQKNRDTAMKRMVKSVVRKQKQSLKQNKLILNHSTQKMNQQSFGKNNETNEQKSILEFSTIQQQPIFLQFQPEEMERLNKLGLMNEAAAYSALSRRKQLLISTYQFNKKTFKTFLKIRGQIVQIEVDHTLPVQNSNFLYVSPVKRRIWHCLLQKSRAKAYKSYQAMICNSRTVGDILEEITFAPSTTLQITHTTPSHQRKLWTTLKENLSLDRIISVQTRSYSQNQHYNNLIPFCYYNIVKMEELIDANAGKVKILELSSPIVREQWNGTGHRLDASFWGNIIKDQSYERFYSKNDQSTFYMLFQDFLKMFKKVQICLYSNLSYLNGQNLTIYKRSKGQCFQLYVKEETDYIFQILQCFSDNNGLIRQDEMNRGTIMIFSKQTTSYIYERGIMSTESLKTTFKMHLKTGKYVIYVKVDKQSAQAYPDNAILQLYSSSPAIIETISELKYRSIIEQGFLTLAEQNKRQEYENGTMWMAFEQLDECGYGFVAFGNKIKSKSTFVIKFNQKDFNKCGYKLKKPYKGGGNQEIVIMPGQQKIILCRKLNDKSIIFRFPPKMDIRKLSLA